MVDHHNPGNYGMTTPQQPWKLVKAGNLSCHLMLSYLELDRCRLLKAAAHLARLLYPGGELNLWWLYNLRELYLAPHSPGGLRHPPGDFPESTWSPGAFFLAESTAKLVCIIHLDFTRTSGGLQMNHMESVESTCQIAVWILPGLTPGSIHLESRRSPFSSECILHYS